jgi:protein O-GlcNAc transferase
MQAMNRSIPGTLQRAITLHTQGKLGEAKELYSQVLRHRPRDFDALHMLGVIALQTGQPEQAVKLIGQALPMKPDHAQARANMGSACLLTGRLDEALRHYDRALALEPRFAGAHNNRGNALELLGRHDEAAQAYGNLLELAPAADFALGNRFHALRNVCDWSDYAGRAASLHAAVDAGKRADRPFSFLSVSDAASSQLQCAREYAASQGFATSLMQHSPSAYGHGRIRVAYLSADFREHVVAYVMAGIYECHDMTRFEIIGVSLAAHDESEIVSRNKASLGAFLDVSRMSDTEAAATLRGMEIDIAVDLTGFTRGCRPGILARRPAAVQINMLGFPGTMGVPYIDYIVADEFVVPKSTESSYAEQIIRLPGTFQATDARRSTLSPVAVPSRAQLHLPASGPVLCSFNNAYKFNPAMFDTWARIMRQVPDSVLWLLAGQPRTQERLRGEAEARGIHPGRLVFAPRVPYAEHLARLTQADLFLDTLPFNAGATASDALWAGVPVLTCAGEAFAARMAGSLLNAIGLRELVTFDIANYELCAVELASDPARLAALKERPAANRHTHPLFDTEDYCRNLEAAYTHVWQRAERGAQPASFTVAPQK